MAGVLNVETNQRALNFYRWKVRGQVANALEMKLGKRQLEIRANGYVSLRQEVQSIPGEWVNLKGKLEIGDEDPLAGDLALFPWAMRQMRTLWEMTSIGPVGRQKRCRR